MMPDPSKFDFPITEVPGQLATKEQLEMFYTRYRFARDHCVGKDVLEIACGGGQGLGYLAAAAKTLTGGDIDVRVLKFPEARYKDRRNIRLLPLDAEALPFPDNSFDTIILFDSVYWLKNIQSFMHECRRVLRKNGTLLLSTVNPSWSSFNPSPYANTYLNATELCQLFENFGFGCEVYGSFRADEASFLRKIVEILRRLAVRLHAVPVSIQWKERIKKIVYGKVTPIPAEVSDAMAAYFKPLRLSAKELGGRFKIIYAVGSLGEKKAPITPRGEISFKTVLVTSNNYNAMLSMAGFIKKYGRHIVTVVVTSKISGSRNNLLGVLNLVLKSGFRYSFFKVLVNKVVPFLLSGFTSSVSGLFRKLGYFPEIIVCDRADDAGVVSRIKSVKPVILLSVGATHIFKNNLIETPSCAAVNLHPSLLPKYRGLEPYFWPLFNGDKEAGVTLHKIVPKLDSGGIICQKKFGLQDVKTELQMIRKCWEASNLALDELYSNPGPLDAPMAQDDSAASFYRRPLARDVGLFLSRGLKLWELKGIRRLLATIKDVNAR